MNIKANENKISNTTVENNKGIVSTTYVSENQKYIISVEELNEEFGVIFGE